MQPLSNDLRKRILEAVDNKEGSRRKLAARFKVNTSTITRFSSSKIGALSDYIASSYSTSLSV